MPQKKTPENRNVENKPRRVPVSGRRDILTVYGKDPAKQYRFVKDHDEGGLQIQKYRRGGWEFSDPTSGLMIGEENVWKSKKGSGSIVRYPAGDGGWLYLMEIRKEWYDEDQAAKQGEIDAVESQISGKRTPESNELDQYGEVSISRK